jgi:anti-sigma-K factor RskA
VKHERATEEIRELAALYALGSLTQHEARSFEIHMREGCSVCESEYRRLARTIAEMGFASEEVPAPDYIRDLLVARIERERPPAAPVVEKAPVKKPEPPPEKPPIKPSVPFVRSQPKREKSHILPWILGIVIIALAAAAGFIWKSSQDENRHLQARFDAARMDTEELRKQIDEQKLKSADLEQMLATMLKPEARIARLIGQTATPHHAGAILWNTKSMECLALGSFDPTPEGKIYQLWFFSPTTKIPVGLIKTDARGHIFVTLPVPKEAEGATAAVVTLEPDNGSQIPTAPYCAAGRID